MTSPAFPFLRGAQTALERERSLRRAHFTPPPRLTGSQWADRYYKLSPESSSVAGQWHGMPFQREPIDVICGRLYREVVFVGASQVVGKTAICVVIPIGFNIDQRPGPILAVEPNLDMAKGLSRDRIDLMFRDTPKLRDKKPLASGRRDSDDTLLFKAGPGWRVTLVGANSPSGLAMRPIRDLHYDEPDRYPPSAGNEGDPMSLGEARVTTFPDHVIVKSGSPVEPDGPIMRAFERSDQRQWVVPCPHCGHEQTLQWGGPNEKFGVKWDREDGKHKPETAYYLCAGNACVISEAEKEGMNRRGKWVAKYLGRPVAGFQLSALPSPLITWAALATKWVEIQGNPEELKAFINTRLAQPYSPPGERYSSATVQKENFGADKEGYPIIPLGVGILTMAVDVQGDRLELLVDGWGAGEECWHLMNSRLAGDVLQKDVWERLELVRNRAWTTASGKEIRIERTAVDTSAYTKQAADYVRPLERRKVIGVKGSSELIHEIVRNPGRKRTEKHRIKQWNVGTITAKDTFFGRLVRVTEAGPGYQHWGSQIDGMFLAQLENEKRVPIRRGTQVLHTYEVVDKHKGNEAVDLVVYNLVALHALGDPVRRALGQYAQALTPKEETPTTPADTEQPELPKPEEAPAPQYQRRRRPFATDW